MFGIDKFDKHAELVNKMADTLGLDLAEAVQRGAMPPEDLRSSVFNCLGCKEVDDCEHWLEENSLGADVAPVYCRNDALFRALRG